MQTIVILNRKGGSAKRSFFRKLAEAVCKAEVSAKSVSHRKCNIL